MSSEATTASRDEAAAGDGPARDVVFAFYRVTWDGAVDRGMQFPEERLAVALMEHPRVGRLVIADGYRSRLAAAVRRVLGAQVGLPARDGLFHARPLRLRRSEPTSERALRAASARYARALRAAAERHGLVDPAVVLCNPLVAAFGDFGWAGSRTYYAWDDWAVHHGERERWPAFEASYDVLRREGWRVAAVTPAILDRMRATGATRVVPNGITPEEWLAPGPAPEWFRALRGPRLLYVGSLDQRLDVALVRATAERFPDGSIVLIGVNYDPEHLAPLERLPNVHLVPPVPRPEIPAITMAADVTLVPHSRTPLTEAMSPLKLYEGLAGGRPVAAVDLAPMRDVDGRVVLAAGGLGFPDAVDRALALGPAPEEERLAYLAASSWTRRFDALVELAVQPG